MNIFKHLLITGILVCGVSAFAGEKAALKNCVHNAMKAGFNMDWNGLKKYCSSDYVKIPENRKVIDRKLLDRTALFFERMQAPDLTFSELVKLNFLMKGQNITDAQLANYRKLDNTDRGKNMVKQAQAQVKAAQDNIRAVVKNVADKVQYGPLYLQNDLAVWFYKLDCGVKTKGVIILRKENGSWKIFREFVTHDNAEKSSVAIEAEVRKFAADCTAASRNFKNWTELLKWNSTDSMAVLWNGKSVSYQQTEKMAKFYDMLQNGNPTMAQAWPLYMEGQGITVTDEMKKQFADQDKSGNGKKVIAQIKNIISKYKESVKNTPNDHSIKHIFLFEDCALLIDTWTLPSTGKTERICLIKKQQGKYLIFRSVTRKAAK